MDEMLPRFGFDESYITSARLLITNSFNEKYESDTDRILHDARYDYLGRVDYIKLSDRLLKERNEHGISTGTGTWKVIQESLLNGHDFFTGTGKILRSVPLEEQIAKLHEWYK